MLRFVDIEDQIEQEQLLAGLKPLPINRMLKQAGREANDFYTRGESGGFRRTRKGRLKNMPKEARQKKLDSDPAFAAEYQRQVIDGQSPRPTDRYHFNGGGMSDSTYYYDRGVDTRGGRPVRENRPYGSDRGKMPDDVKQRTIQRQQKAKEAINDWDPIEASAQEDYNRLKGGRRGPQISPDAVLGLPAYSTPLGEPVPTIGETMFPGV